MHDFETKLRRDARAIEEDAPAGMVANVRGQLGRDVPSKLTGPRAHRRVLLAAALILVVAGGSFWVALSLHGSDRGAVQPMDFAATHDPDPLTPGVLSITWPSEGIEMATHAGEPLTREWERVKSDSISLLRGFERQIPRL